MGKEEGFSSSAVVFVLSRASLTLMSAGASIEEKERGREDIRRAKCVEEC